MEHGPQGKDSDRPPGGVKPMSVTIQAEAPAANPSATKGGATPGAKAPNPKTQAPSGEGGKASETDNKVEELTTERLQASLLESFRGKTETETPPEGATPNEPEPGANEPSAPGEGTQVTEPPEGGTANEEPEGGDQSNKGLIDAVTALRAERRELKAELEKVRGEIEGLKAGKEKPAQEEEGAGGSAPSRTDPAMFDGEVQEVLRAEAGQRELKGWAQRQLRVLDKTPDAVVAELKRRQIDLGSEEPETIQEWLQTVHENASEKLEELIVERRAVLNVARQRASEVQQSTATIAETILPERKDASSDRAKLFGHVMKNNPGLKQTPDGEMRAAVQVLGIEGAMQVIAAGGQDPIKVLRLEKLGLSGNGSIPPLRDPAKGSPTHTNGKVVHQRPTTRLPGPPAGAPPGGATEEPDAHALYERFKKEPTEENRVAWVKAGLRRSK